MCEVKSKVMLRPTVSRPIYLGVKPYWYTRPDFCYCQTVGGLLMWGALSEERMDLSFTTAAGPRQRSHSPVRFPRDSWPYFTLSDSGLPQCGGPVPVFIFPETRWPSFIPSLGSFVASCYSQGYGGGSRSRLHTIHSHVRVSVAVKVTLRLAFNRQSLCLVAKPLEVHDQIFFAAEPLRS
jgi:hypothetical protein